MAGSKKSAAEQNGKLSSKTESKARKSTKPMDQAATPGSAETGADTKSQSAELPAAALQQGLGGDAPAASGTGTYIVLRATSGKSDASGVLFADTGGTSGVEVVGDMNSASGKFFAVGRRYIHKSSGKEFVCIGVFGSPSEASIVHPELTSAGSWNRLSPADSIRLGKGGWIVGKV